MAMQWIECSKELPADGQIVRTKIDDARGCRNETTLYRSGNLWFVADGSMYVYYCPTHWQAVDPSQEAAYRAALSRANAAAAEADRLRRSL